MSISYRYTCVLGHGYVFETRDEDDDAPTFCLEDGSDIVPGSLTVIDEPQIEDNVEITGEFDVTNATFEGFSHNKLDDVGTHTHAEIDAHIGDTSIHAAINDQGTASSELWSAQKISAALADKVTGAANIGVSGVALFAGKTDAALNFRKIDSSTTVTVSTDSISHAYEFENESADDTFGDRHGTLHGGVSFTEGKVGAISVELDGENGTRISLGDLDLADADSFSISCWFLAHSFSDARLVAKAYGTHTSEHIFSVQVPSNSQVAFRLTTGTVGTGTELIGSASLWADVWYHVIASYDGSAYALHLNGQMIAQQAKSGSVPLGTGYDVAIGNQPVSGQGERPFHGHIDQVVFWNHALTAAEISLLYNGGSGNSLQLFEGAQIQLHVAQNAIDHDALRNVGANTHDDIDEHIAESAIHTRINDNSTTSTSEAWSANRIASSLLGKSDLEHTHTSSDIVDFAASADARIAVQKAAPNGLATLDSGGKILPQQLPDFAITNVYVVDTTDDRDALIVQTGDVAKVEHDVATYIFDGEEWVPIHETSDIVSVNGQSGVVVLNSDHIGEGSANKYYTEARVADNETVASNSAHRSAQNNPHNVTKSQVGLGNVENVKHNYSASTAPTGANNSTQGYQVGSRWTDSVNKRDYVCAAATGTAVWKETTASDGAGEVNTAVNVGTSGVSIVEGKSGSELQFRSVAAASARLTAAYNGNSKSVNLDVVESQLNHNALANYSANRHVDHSAVSVLAGTGLAGGGTIASTRTISLAFGSLPSVDTVGQAAETLVVYRPASADYKQTPVSNLPFGNVSTSFPAGTMANQIAVFASTDGKTLTSAGVRNFGARASDPAGVAPTSGDEYYHTGLQQKMCYDGSRGKWLSVSTFQDGAGRSGTTTGGGFYRRFNGMLLNVGQGPPIPKGTITRVSFATSVAATHTLEVLVGGVVVASLSSNGAASLANDTVNADFDAGIFAVRNKSGSATTTNLQALVFYKLRSP